MTHRAIILAQIATPHRAIVLTWFVASVINSYIMNKEQAATSLGISVRSLQRLVQSEKISVKYKRGESGKQEAVFDAEELANYKSERDSETVKPSNATISDTALARNDTHQFLELLRTAVTPTEVKTSSVAIADKPLLKLDEASALTGLSRDTLRKAIDAKGLKGKIIGRAYRIKRADLDRYIKNL
jgi:excisionase family DNA binding protein